MYICIYIILCILHIIILYIIIYLIYVYMYSIYRFVIEVSFHCIMCRSMVAVSTLLCVYVKFDH